VFVFCDAESVMCLRGAAVLRGSEAKNMTEKQHLFRVKKAEMRSFGALSCALDQLVSDSSP
jgi:hypothetical protein